MQRRQWVSEEEEGADALVAALGHILADHPAAVLERTEGGGRTSRVVQIRLGVVEGGCRASKRILTFWFVGLGQTASTSRFHQSNSAWIDQAST